MIFFAYCSARWETNPFSIFLLRSRMQESLARPAFYECPKELQEVLFGPYYTLQKSATSQAGLLPGHMQE